MSICIRHDCPGRGCRGGGVGCPVTEDRIDEEIKTPHQCGSCSLCCKVMPIDEEGVEKLDGELCRHCDPVSRKPCTIYQNRPRVCKGFVCGWLAGVLPDHWKPSESGLILSAAAGASEPIAVWQDVGTENKWKAEPFWSDLLEIAAHSLSRNGKFTVVYPPRYRIGMSYNVVDPISRSTLELQADELVVLLMGMPLMIIHEKFVDKWRVDVPVFTEKFNKASTVIDATVERMYALDRAQSMGWKIGGGRVERSTDAVQRP